MNSVDSGVIDIFKFLSSNRCKIASYAVREGFAYFTDYAMEELDDVGIQSIMWAYYIVNCSDFDFPLHIPRLASDKVVLNSKLCGVPLICFATLLRKREVVDFFKSREICKENISSNDVEIVKVLKTAFVSEYEKHNNHSEYLNLFKDYMLKKSNYSDKYVLSGERNRK